MPLLPLNDAAMLASVINRYLRDGEYADLGDICASFDLERERLEEILAGGGFAYSPELNKVR